jgi:hypothetical protein
MPPKKTTTNASYKVMPIDVTGDNVPDGDLIQQFKNGKLISSKFVPYDKIETLTSSLPKSSSVKAKKKVVYKNVNNLPMEQPNQLIVADNTSFAQSLKTGFATGLGREAASAAFDAVAGLFE